MPSAIKDGAPDAWGQRVIWAAELAKKGLDRNVTGPEDFGDEFYLLASGTDRVGALDFQPSATIYLPRGENASLADLCTAADKVDRGEPLPRSLVAVIEHATSIGGARPKAVLNDASGSWLAKFSSSTDIFDVVGAEAVATYLARFAGIDVPEVKISAVAGRKAILTRRFDRLVDGRRRQVLTALTLLGHGLGLVPRGSYPEFVDVVTASGGEAGCEMFTRAAFNIAITNTDDHLRNHSAFWDGQSLSLTPAYDLSPGSRTGDIATLATPYSQKGEKSADFASLLRAAGEFGMSKQHAYEQIDKVQSAIADHFDEAAEFAQLTSTEKTRLRDRQFLHRSTLFGWERATESCNEIGLISKASRS
jgi:serine/threonine-protein kinase HipA